LLDPLLAGLGEFMAEPGVSVEMVDDLGKGFGVTGWDDETIGAVGE
jgi:hypothetical protein